MGQLLSNRARKSRSKSRSISRGSTGDADSVSGDFDEQDHSDDDDFHSLKSMECTTPQQENLTDWSKYQNRPKEVVSDEPVCVDEDLLAVVKEDNALDASAGISASQVASGLGLKLVLDPKHAWADTTLLAKRSEHHRLLHSTDILDKVRKSHSADTQSEGSVTTLLMIAHEATQAIDNTVAKSKEGVLAPATAVEESTKETPPNNSKHVITEDIPDDNSDKEPVDESKISNRFEKFSDAESLAHQEPDEDISSRAHASIFQESRIQEKQGVSHMSPCEKDADQVTAASDRLQLETTNDSNSVGKGKKYLRHRVILPLPRLRCRKGPKTMQKHAALPSNTQSQLQSTATITNEGASNVPSGTLSFGQTNKISNERNVTGKEHEKVTSTITSDGSGTIVGVSDETSRQKHLERADNVRTASASAARSSDATQSSAVSKSSDQNKQSRQLSSYSLSHECDKALQGESQSDSVGLINRDHTISGTPRVTAKKVQNLSRAQTADSLETSKSSKRPRPALENSAVKNGKRMEQRKSDKDDDHVAIISSGRPDDYICLFCQFEIFCRGYKEVKRRKGYYKRKKEKVEQSHEAPIAEAGSSSSSSATSDKRLIGL